MLFFYCAGVYLPIKNPNRPLIMQNVNLKEALTHNRDRRIKDRAEAAVEEAFNILLDDVCRERDIQNKLGGKSASKSQNAFSWAALDPKRLYAIEDVKKTCVEYRLRFLDTKKFKGEIPREAITEIKNLERTLGEELEDFKIMAPDSKFRLEDCDKDPVLFLKLSDNYYYLIHQWGGDLAWYRKMVMWPLRSFATLTATIAAVSLLLAFMVPTELLLGESAAQSGFARVALFFWFLVSITSMVTYVGFAFFKNVSVRQWNSPFFKQEF